MKRVVVVGTSGSGKTTVARELARRLEVPHIELDSLFHLPGWQPRPDEEMHAELDRLLDDRGWVLDGNYRRYTMDGHGWERADTVVWLHPPKWRVMTRILRRTIARGLFRHELWNGNRETLRSLLNWSDPEKNIVLWSWTTYEKNQDRYQAAMADPRFAHLRFVVLRANTEVRDFLAAL